MSVTMAMAEFVVRTRYEDLPEGAILRGKQAFADTVGIVVAGSLEQPSKILAEYIRRTGGDPVASAISCGFKTSARNAALLNGTAGDVHGLSATSDVMNHPTITVMPAVWALAEGMEASGKDILLACILGVEVSSKIARPLHPALTAKGFHPVSIFGAFGATAAAGKVLSLNEKEMANALGLAGAEASGIKAAMGTMAKAYSRGRAAENGVVAAELAAIGFTGPTTVLEGLDGFFQTFGDGANPAGIPATLGNPYEIASPGLTYKPYPSCTASHTTIDAIKKLKAEYDFTAADVESVECLVSPVVVNYMKYIEPTGPLEAKYSLQFCCAAALVDGDVTIDTFRDKKLADPTIVGLMKRIKIRVSPELAALGYDPPGARLSSTPVITLKSGKEVRHRQDKLVWGPTTPPTWESLLGKYRTCASRVLGAKEVEESIEIMAHLEEAPNLRRLMHVVRGG